MSNCRLNARPTHSAVRLSNLIIPDELDGVGKGLVGHTPTKLAGLSLSAQPDNILAP